MAGYRCVNYHELCRLCTNSSGSKIHIFSEEGKKLKLYHKITECLPVVVNELDKLPKIVCSQCIQQVEIIADYRETCINAQNMLQSCLNTPKLRNGGKVYIKDVISRKLPSSTTITKTGPTNSVGTITQGSDFLSSIIQAVGIQNVEESTPESSVQALPRTTQTQTQIPQYTLSFDGQTIKTNQIQYKIEEPAQYTINDVESDKLSQSVNEFLKLNKKPTPAKKEITPVAKFNSTIIKKVPKVEKPPAKPMQQKINFVLTTPTKQVKQTVAPVQVQQPQPHHIVLPIQFKESTGETQIFTQIDGKNVMLPTTYVQMKLPQQFTTVEGHRIVPLSTANMSNITLQPTQTIQHSNIQTSTPQHKIAYTTSTNPSSTSTTNFSPSFRITTSTPKKNQVTQSTQSQQIQTITIPSGGIQLTTMPSLQAKPQPKFQYQSIKTEPTALTPTVTMRPKTTQTTPLPPKLIVTNIKKEISPEPITTSPVITATPTVVTTTATTSTSIATVTASGSPTTCETCGKVFKRKEHLVQHMKLHIGLRPFVCIESGCNKTFSRKEHLMRHIVSHTGKKMFSCNLCQKLFSRKDNLNKHKRTHPEVSQTSTNASKVNNVVTTTTAGQTVKSETVDVKPLLSKTSTTTSTTVTPTNVSNDATENYVCDVCSKVYAVKYYYMEHRKLHDMFDDSDKQSGKKTKKLKGQKKNSSTSTEISTDTDSLQMGAIIDQPDVKPNITTLTQQLPTSQQQMVQIHLSTPIHTTNSSNKTHDAAVLTLPSSMASIVSLHPNYITSDIMGSYKIDI